MDSKKNKNDDTQVPALSGADTKLYANYTGQGIRKRDPEKYDAIVRALKHGLSLRQCADVFKVKKDTVGAICVRELGRDGMRRTTENNLRLLAHKASTDLIEDMDKISPSQKGIIMGITLDKLDRVESRREQLPALTQNNTLNLHSPNITPEAVREFFSGLKDAPKTIDIEDNEKDNQ
jgi:hypothetical protein|tara:strand:+ start:236 stop:769 length:534 start_codon:yes stop_codon:yes gene_type:complete